MWNWLKKQYYEIKLSVLLDERKGAYQSGEYDMVELLDEEVDEICNRHGFTIDDIYKFM